MSVDIVVGPESSNARLMYNATRRVQALRAAPTLPQVSPEVINVVIMSSYIGYMALGMATDIQQFRFFVSYIHDSFLDIRRADSHTTRYYCVLLVDERVSERILLVRQSLMGVVSRAALF